MVTKALPKMADDFWSEYCHAAISYDQALRGLLRMCLLQVWMEPEPSRSKRKWGILSPFPQFKVVVVEESHDVVDLPVARLVFVLILITTDADDVPRAAILSQCLGSVEFVWKKNHRVSLRMY